MICSGCNQKPASCNLSDQINTKDGTAYIRTRYFCGTCYPDPK